MTDTCVACGEVAEGKPLYKKLGSNDCQVEVFAALHEMQLLSLPSHLKNKHYICWDCDEIIAEEYASFTANEAKRKALDAKRKQQDEARTVKLNKKLKQAFKKAHSDALKAKGIAPPVSKYKMKEIVREEKKFFSTYCLFCKLSFESMRGSFQRYHLEKMVSEDCSVADVLKTFGLNPNLSSEEKRKRFVCGQCYGKLRRQHKTSNKKENQQVSANKSSADAVKSKENGSVFSHRRPTTKEHAAEIAKLIPPSLANMYKVVTEECKGSQQSNTSTSSFLSKRKERKNFADERKRKRKAPKKITGNYESESDQDESIRDGKKLKISHKTLPLSSKHKNSNKVLETPPVPKVKLKNVEGNTYVHSSRPNVSSVRTILPKGTDQSGFNENDVAAPLSFSSNDSSLVDFGICNVCGLGYNSRHEEFWHNLHRNVKEINGITIMRALEILETELADVSNSVREKAFVCKPCFSRVCKGFKSQVLERTAEKMGVSTDKLVPSDIDGSKLNSSTEDALKSTQSSRKSSKQSTKKVNGSFVIDENYCSSISKKVKDDHKLPASSKVTPLKDASSKGDSNFAKKRQTQDTSPTVFKFKRRSTYKSESKFASVDSQLIELINMSQHLRYKGKVVFLRSVSVDLADLKSILPRSSMSARTCIPLEQFSEMYQYGNFHRNLRSGKIWSVCIICQREELKIDKTTKWLDDPIAPPNLMVPIRWAQLSVAKLSTSANLTTDDGKICRRCHRSLTENFTKFVSIKVAASHGLTSEQFPLHKYKVSFDSLAMNIVADPLESPTDQKSHSGGLRNPGNAKEVPSTKPNNTNDVNCLNGNAESGSCDYVLNKDSEDTRPTNTKPLNDASKEDQANQKNPGDLTNPNDEKSFKTNQSNEVNHDFSDYSSTASKGQSLNICPQREEISDAFNQSFESLSHDNVSMDLHLSDSDSENEEKVQENTSNLVHTFNDTEKVEYFDVADPNSKIVPTDGNVSENKLDENDALNEKSISKNYEICKEVGDHENCITESAVEKDKISVVDQMSSNLEECSDSVNVNIQEDESKTSSESGETSQSTSDCHKGDAIIDNTPSKDSSTRISLNSESELNGNDDSTSSKSEDYDLISADRIKTVNKSPEPLNEVEIEKCSKEHFADSHKPQSDEEKNLETTSLNHSSEIEDDDNNSNDIVKSPNLHSQDKTTIYLKELQSSTEQDIRINGLESRAEESEKSESKTLKKANKREVITFDSSSENDSEFEGKEDCKGVKFGDSTTFMTNAEEGPIQCLENKELPSEQLTGKENTILTGEENAVLTSKENAALTGKENAVLTGEENAVLTPEENAVLTGEENAVLTREENAVLTREENAVLTRKENADCSVRNNSPTSFVDSVVTDREMRNNSLMDVDQTKVINNSCAENDSSSESIEDNSFEEEKTTSSIRIFSQKVAHKTANFLRCKRKAIEGKTNEDQLRSPGSLLALTSEGTVDDEVQIEFGEDEVAPFAQRKRFKGKNLRQSGSSTSMKMVTRKIWQTLQCISLDDLLERDLEQPLELCQFNAGLLLALNDFRAHLGGSLADLTYWFRKLLPFEYREKDLEPSVEKFSNYLLNLKANDPVESLFEILDQVLPEDLFFSSKRLGLTKDDREVGIYIEDVMNDAYQTKEEISSWEHFLNPVNLDKLFAGEPCRVSWADFNNGLLYALWNVNRMLDGSSGDLMKWLSLVSTSKMKDKDYEDMVKGVPAIHEHLEKYPEYQKLVAPIVIKNVNSVSPSKSKKRRSVSNSGSLEHESVVRSLTSTTASADFGVSFPPKVKMLNDKNSTNDVFKTGVNYSRFNTGRSKHSNVLKEKGRSSRKSYPNDRNSPILPSTDESNHNGPSSYGVIRVRTPPLEEVIDDSSLQCDIKSEISIGEEVLDLRDYNNDDELLTSEDFVDKDPFVSSSENVFSNSVGMRKHLKISPSLMYSTNAMPNSNDQSVSSPNSINESSAKTSDRTLSSIVPQSNTFSTDLSSHLNQNLTTTQSYPVIPVIQRNSRGCMTLLTYPLTLPHAVNGKGSQDTFQQHHSLLSPFPPASPICIPGVNSELANKVDVLEKQLDEIRKQNCQLIKMNHALIQSSINPSEAPSLRLSPDSRRRSFSSEEEIKITSPYGQSDEAEPSFLNDPLDDPLALPSPPRGFETTSEECANDVFIQEST